MFTPSGVTRVELEARTHKLVRKAGKQVLLIASEGRLFAIANRCPHEGYPLSEGTLGPGCVLTCNWHNWKFDLAQGTALVGRDPVRTYPIEERNGEIFIDLADQMIQLPRRHIPLNLLVPFVRHEFLEPCGETRKFLRGQLGNGLF